MRVVRLGRIAVATRRARESKQRRGRRQHHWSKRVAQRITQQADERRHCRAAKRVALVSDGQVNHTKCCQRRPARPQRRRRHRRCRACHGWRAVIQRPAPTCAPTTFAVTVAFAFPVTVTLLTFAVALPVTLTLPLPITLAGVMVAVARGVAMTQVASVPMVATAHAAVVVRQPAACAVRAAAERRAGPAAAALTTHQQRGCHRVGVCAWRNAQVQQRGVAATRAAAHGGAAVSRCRRRQAGAAVPRYG